MEKWEHATLRTMALLSGPADGMVQFIAPDGALVNLGRNASIGSAMKALNELGAEGWRLANAVIQTFATGETVTYFLIRPRP